MWSAFKRLFRKKTKGGEIYPDEIFLDAQNLPAFDKNQFEGRLEKPISRRAIAMVGLVFLSGATLFGVRSWNLQVVHGKAYALRSEQNRLRHILIFGERGAIYDRHDELLVSNIPNTDPANFSIRSYPTSGGFSHLLGYVGYPSKDSAGFYYTSNIEGEEGIEKFYNAALAGKNGVELIEINALGKIETESVIYPPQNGDNLHLSVDREVQEKLYGEIESLAKQVGFEGGAGVIIDVESGEILAMTSYPEYDSGVIADGSDETTISKYLTDSKKPFLDRAASGLYTPGSIVKPFLAMGALEEGVIDPETSILSTGSISIPNPFDKTKRSVFTDWKAHGYVDMRQALAVSSNVYFYEVGGGFEGQKGLGIANIEKYMRLFGFGAEIPGQFFGDKKGVLPNPEWKALNFDGEVWRIGDTYNTAIGQYGVQVTPLQAARAIAAIANGGKLLNPSVLLGGSPDGRISEVLPFTEGYFKVVQEGMREAVLSGTAKGLDIPEVTVAAKTGTAELGSLKQYVNSWVIGFFPYEKPRYAFAVLMEKGPRDNLLGGLFVMRGMLDWMKVNAPEYVTNP